MRLYGIVGYGGFGREVMPLARVMLRKALPEADYKLVFVDQKPSTLLINGHEVLSFEDFYTASATHKYFNVAIANHNTRKSISEKMLGNNIQPFQISAENAVALDHNEIGDGAIFCSFTTLTSNAKIGKFFHANIYSYVAHDCVIGDYVTFAPNVHCNGNVIIENNVYVGTGVIIREGTPEKPMIIGEGAILGMGAVVTKSVAAFETVVGNPAAPFKQVRKADA
jgi:sugar O-acyltransferase (sialic acid O-acetyltransferase NeuD family)